MTASADGRGSPRFSLPARRLAVLPSRTVIRIVDRRCAAVVGLGLEKLEPTIGLEPMTCRTGGPTARARPARRGLHHGQLTSPD